MFFRTFISICAIPCRNDGVCVMSAPLLLSVAAAAALLSVSRRTIFRLIEKRVLPCRNVGRLVRIPASALQNFVAHGKSCGQNVDCSGPDAHGENTCHTEEVIRNVGGSVMSTRAAKELDDLLKQLTTRKRKKSSLNTVSKSTTNGSGTRRQNDSLTK